MARLFDMHCHLGWFADAPIVARMAAASGLSIFANTVTPAEFARTASALADSGNVFVGVGAHPWWVADGRIADKDVDRAAELAYECAFVGEVGLDRSDAHTPADSHTTQIDALRRILTACDAGARANGRKLISLHAVRGAGIVLDLLEESGCIGSCSCVLHWFSGTGDELHRAVRTGCHLSINEMMLRTRRGREYARQLPVGLLLTETDLPPDEGSDLGVDAIVASLGRTLDRLQDIRGEDVRDLVADNATSLLAGIASTPGGPA